MVASRLGCKAVRKMYEYVDALRGRVVGWVVASWIRKCVNMWDD